MSNMLKKMICFTAIVALLGIGAAISQESQEKKAPTADRHKERGLACGVCHAGEEAPTTAAKPDSCFMCHESLSAVAGRTKGFSVNPHKNHISESSDLACTQCHQGHKDDTVICFGCHAGMKFK
jgi:hypothetical protein